MADKAKLVTAEDGWGNVKTMRAEYLPIMQETCKEMMEAALKCGKTREEAEKYLILTVKEGT